MIITLCGSARFEPWFHMWNEVLGLSGIPCFGLSAYPSQKVEGKDWYTEAQKIRLDETHRNKIACSTGILVLNVFGYIGESTMREIEFARANEKRTYFLESWGKGCGVGSLHNSLVRMSKEKYGIPRNYMSPIDTFECQSRPSPWSLPLGECGPYRSALVERIHSAEDAALRAVI